MAREAIYPRAGVASLPALIKGYLRLGAGLVTAAVVRPAIGDNRCVRFGAAGSRASIHATVTHFRRQMPAQRVYGLPMRNARPDGVGPGVFVTCVQIAFLQISFCGARRGIVIDVILRNV